jgi:hypothetical protein
MLLLTLASSAAFESGPVAPTAMLAVSPVHMTT